MISILQSKRINFDELWSTVLATVQSVINMSRYGTIDATTWQTRFFDVYYLCSSTPDSHAEELYEKTKTFLEAHCRSMRQDIVESGQNTLSIYVKYWNEYKIGAENLNNLYSCVNNLIAKKRDVICIGNNELHISQLQVDDTPTEIGQLALECWTQIIIVPLKERIVKLLLEQIHLDRIGECVNQTTIKTVIMSFVDVYRNRKIDSLDLYEKYFESSLLQSTGEYYREQGNLYLTKLDCIQYMKKVLTVVDEEDFRSRKFLNPTSYKKVNNECLQRLVCDHFDLLKDECDKLIPKENYDALHNMYKLLSPTNIGIEYMVERFKQHIILVGNEKIQSIKGENLQILFVETLIELYRQFSNIIHETFINDPTFVSSLDQAFAVIINMKNKNHLPMKASEIVACYCDNLLRKSSKMSSESDLEERLLHGISIFKYLQDKDYFQISYQRMFARRLINQNSTSTDFEEFMIAKLREVCGYEFTSKLTRMLQDIKISADLNGKFLNYLRSESTLDLEKQTITNLVGLDFNIYVLQANIWPITQSMHNTFSLPLVLEKPLRLFEAFYSLQHNGRKLYWVYNLSTGEVRMSYADRSYFVTMVTYQMAILLAFNEYNTLTLNEIQDITKLQMKEIEKQILPLIENKILLNDANDLTLTSVISINPEFKSKRTKFKLVSMPSKQTNIESEGLQKALDSERKFYLQAIIVRIMKSRKTLKHNLLLDEVIAQSKERFLPSINLIKKCIEILIDKQYIERSSADEYTYIS